MTAERPLPARPAPAARVSAEARLAAPRKRPDARPMRVVFGIGALTAISVMGAGFVRPSWSVTDASVADAVDQTGQTAQVGSAPIQVNHVIRYVKLKPGQKAPAGAKVINAADPAPRIVVTHIAGPAPAHAQRQAVKTKTKQSGKP